MDVVVVKNNEYNFVMLSEDLVILNKLIIVYHLKKLIKKYHKDELIILQKRESLETSNLSFSKTIKPSKVSKKILDDHIVKRKENLEKVSIMDLMTELNPEEVFNELDQMKANSEKITDEISKSLEEKSTQIKKTDNEDPKRDENLSETDIDKSKSRKLTADLDDPDSLNNKSDTNNLEEVKKAKEFNNNASLFLYNSNLNKDIILETNIYLEELNCKIIKYKNVISLVTVENNKILNFSKEIKEEKSNVNKWFTLNLIVKCKDDPKIKFKLNLVPKNLNIKDIEIPKDKDNKITIVILDKKNDRLEIIQNDNLSSISVKNFLPCPNYKLEYTTIFLFDRMMNTRRENILDKVDAISKFLPINRLNFLECMKTTHISTYKEGSKFDAIKNLDNETRSLINYKDRDELILINSLSEERHLLHLKDCYCFYENIESKKDTFKDDIEERMKISLLYKTKKTVENEIFKEKMIDLNNPKVNFRYGLINNLNNLSKILNLDNHVIIPIDIRLSSSIFSRNLFDLACLEDESNLEFINDLEEELVREQEEYETNLLNEDEKEENSLTEEVEMLRLNVAIIFTKESYKNYLQINEKNTDKEEFASKDDSKMERKTEYEKEKVIIKSIICFSIDEITRLFSKYKKSFIESKVNLEIYEKIALSKMLNIKWNEMKVPAYGLENINRIKVPVEYESREQMCFFEYNNESLNLNFMNIDYNEIFFSRLILFLSSCTIMMKYNDDPILVRLYNSFFMLFKTFPNKDLLYDVLVKANLIVMDDAELLEENMLNIKTKTYFFENYLELRKNTKSNLKNKHDKQKKFEIVLYDKKSILKNWMMDRHFSFINNHIENSKSVIDYWKHNK